MFKKLLFVFLTSILGFQVHAAEVTFSTSIVTVEIDDGTGTYTGTSVGDVFSGTFVFGNVASQGTTSEVTSFRTIYSFSGSRYGSTISNGIGSTDSSVSSIEINDDAPISDGEATQLNDLFGTNIAGGDLLDSWSAYGVTDGAFFDIDDTFKNGTEFGITLYFDTSTYTDVDLKTSPPALTNIIGGIFFVVEADALGNQKFVAFGTIDDITALPLPTCDIQLNQTTFVDGETVTADVFRIANLAGASISTEIKIWLGVPRIPPIGVFPGADDTFVLPDGTDVDLGPVPLSSVTSAWPRGDYEFSCRMLDPVTGELLAEDRNFFEIE